MLQSGFQCIYKLSISSKWSTANSSCYLPFFSAAVTLLCQKLVRLCGEVLAAPTENEEIQFLCIVCAKLKQDPYLVNFFLEVGCYDTREKKS